MPTRRRPAVLLLGPLLLALLLTGCPKRPVTTVATAPPPTPAPPPRPPPPTRPPPGPGTAIATTCGAARSCSCPATSSSGHAAAGACPSACPGTEACGVCRQRRNQGHSLQLRQGEHPA